MINNNKCEDTCNVAECAFDGQDCLEEDIPQCAPGCSPIQINDGICQ